MADKYAPYMYNDHADEISAAQKQLDAINDINEMQARMDEERQKQKLQMIEQEFAFRKGLLEQYASLETELDSQVADDARKQWEEDSKKKIKAEMAAAKKKNGGKLSDAQKQEIINRYKYDDKIKQQYEKKQAQRRKAEIEREALESNAQYKAFQKSKLNHALGITNAVDTANKLKENGVSDGKAGVMAAISAISSLAKQLETQVDTIANYKSAWDTRLQGSKNATSFGSYHDQMSQDITGIVALSPYIKQETMYQNLSTMIDKGIAYNVEQRAFLMTISDKIATTFNATDSTLLKLVRIQQKDSTAARLGMESALTSFLNNMYETTEYMSDMASSIRSNLYEAEALMSDTAATEFEYQVQKWMGSLYSVGMSDSSVSSISSTLGKLASGDVSALDSETGSLMVMAANKAGYSIGEILQEGLDADNTNKLLQSMVNYLADIANSSSDSKLISQQMAKVYGVTASDLKAVASLADAKTMEAVTADMTSYSDMLTQLNNMANTMYKRVSVGEMMNNVWDNFQYTMAGGMADNPITYLTYKAATLLDDVAGGIAIPALSYVGTGYDLETTVSDLMRVGAMSGGIISGIGSMITHLGGGAGFNGAGMISAFTKNTSSSNVLTRGNGGSTNTLTVGGGSVSSSGYIGNTSGDVYNHTVNEASDDANSKMVEAKEENSDEVTNDVINQNIVDILGILKAVTSGESAFYTQEMVNWG